MNTEKFIKQKSLNGADGVCCVAEARSAWRWWARHEGLGRSKPQCWGRWAAQEPLLLLSSPCTTGFCRGQKQCPLPVTLPFNLPWTSPASHLHLPRETLAKWLGKKIQRWVEEKLPSFLIPSFDTLIIFNTTWQLFVFSLNPFYIGQTFILLLFLKGRIFASHEIQVPAPQRRTVHGQIWAVFNFSRPIQPL